MYVYTLCTRPCSVQAQYSRSYCIISQSYLTTGSLPPISSSWRQALETHDQTFFFQLNSCVNRPCVTSSLTRRWVRLLWIFLAFRQLYLSHTYGMLLKISSFCAIHKSFVSTGFTEQIMPILRFKHPVRTSQETVSITTTNRLILLGNKWMCTARIVTNTYIYCMGKIQRF
jgi:hypothetical protein